MKKNPQNAIKNTDPLQELFTFSFIWSLVSSHARDFVEKKKSIENYFVLPHEFMCSFSFYFNQNWFFLPTTNYLWLSRFDDFEAANPLICWIISFNVFSNCSSLHFYMQFLSMRFKSMIKQQYLLIVKDDLRKFQSLMHRIWRVFFSSCCLCFVLFCFFFCKCIEEPLHRKSHKTKWEIVHS